MNGNGWFEVDKKLPRMDETVDVFHMSLGEREGRLIFYLGIKQWYVDQWGKVSLNRITHWKPKKVKK